MDPANNPSLHPEQEYPVFIKRGDARAEVDALVSGFGVAPEAAGFHKYIYVTQANQTVLMVTGRDTPLADAVRGREGWIEPVERS